LPHERTAIQIQWRIVELFSFFPVPACIGHSKVLLNSLKEFATETFFELFIALIDFRLFRDIVAVFNLLRFGLSKASEVTLQICVRFGYITKHEHFTLLLLDWLLHKHIRCFIGGGGLMLLIRIH
jgi:hypothetical protein